MNEAIQRLAGEVIGVLGEPPPELIRGQRARLLSEPSPRPRVRWVILPALAAAGVGLLAWRGGILTEQTALRPGPAPLASAEEERWLRAPSDADLPPVALGDGSEVRVRQGARGRLARPDRRRVRVTVESGRMDVSVNPAAGKAWQVNAGAYRVMVLGTVFFVEHRPTDEIVEIGVDRGRVAITGGKLGTETLTLGAGSRFRAGGGGIDVKPAPGPVEGPTGASAAAGPTGGSEAAGPPKRARPTWQTLHRAGQYAAAVAEAERAGWGKLLASGRAPEVADLADAARLAGDAERARSALLLLRRRFAHTDEAATAAFLLGRMDADRATDLNAAARWLETSLREQPEGPYAREALGRLMVVYRRAGAPGPARATAEGYLRRHAEGPYADLARSLVAGAAAPGR